MSSIDLVSLLKKKKPVQPENHLQVVESGRTDEDIAHGLLLKMTA